MNTNKSFVPLNQIDQLLYENLFTGIKTNKNQIPETIEKVFENKNISFPLLCNIILNAEKIEKTDSLTAKKIEEVCIEMFTEKFKKTEAVKPSEPTLALFMILNNRVEELLNNWNSLKLPPEDQMIICHALIGSKKEAGVESIAFITANLNFEGIDRKKLLNLCSHVALHNPLAGIMFSLHFYAKFSGLTTKNANIDDRLEWWKAVSRQGPVAANKLLEMFDQLGLDGIAAMKQRAALYAFLALQSPEAAMQVVNLIAHYHSEGDGQSLGLDEELRFELFKSLIQQKPEIAHELLKHIDSFAFPEEHQAELFRLALKSPCVLELLSGYDVNRIPLNYFEKQFNKLELNSLPLEECLNFYKDIIENNGIFGVIVLIKLHQNLRLGEADPSQLFTLGVDMIKQGKEAAEFFMKSPLRNVVFQEQNTQKRFELCQLIASQDAELARMMTAAAPFFIFPDREILNQFETKIALDLCLPPFKPNETFLEGKNLSPLSPIIKILCNEEPEAKQLQETEKLFQNFLVQQKKLSKLIMPLLKKIQHEKNNFVKFTLYNWAAYAAGILYTLDEDQLKKIEKSGVLEMIFHHRSPSNRYLLTRFLVDNIENLCEKNGAITKACEEIEEKKETRNLLSGLLLQSDKFTGPSLQEAISMKMIAEEFSREMLADLDETENQRKKERVLLSSVLLTTFADQSEIITEIIRRIGDITDFKDSKRLNSLIQFLIEMISQQPYKTEEKEQILNCLKEVLQKDESSKISFSKMISEKLDVLTNLLKIFGKENLIKVLEEKKDLKEYFQEQFKSLFNLEKIENFHNKYQKTIGSFRNPVALLTYLRRISGLPKNELDPVKSGLDVFVASVLEGNFKKVRYSQEKNPHLKSIFTLNPSIEKIWTSSDKPIEHVYKNLKIEETDDPCDLLLIGTEVSGSCQHINDSPYTNKCLLSYIMNGEIKAIVLKDMNNRIAARAIIRLMVDDADIENPKTILLLERIHSNYLEDSINNEIVKWAIKKAEQMEIQLVTAAFENKTPYEGKASYLGGFAPFVYSDAAGGVKNSPFSIDKKLFKIE